MLDVAVAGPAVEVGGVRRIGILAKRIGWEEGYLPGSRITPFGDDLGLKYGED